MLLALFDGVLERSWNFCAAQHSEIQLSDSGEGLGSLYIGGKSKRCVHTALWRGAGEAVWRFSKEKHFRIRELGAAHSRQRETVFKREKGEWRTDARQIL